MNHFDLSYDYRCPFAKNIHLHVVTALEAGADFDVRFVPWTLSQSHRPEGAPDVWSDPERDADLLSLAVGVSIHDQQPDVFLASHGALFVLDTSEASGWSISTRSPERSTASTSTSTRCVLTSNRVGHTK